MTSLYPSYRCEHCGKATRGGRPNGSLQRWRRKLLHLARQRQDNRCCWCHHEMIDVLNDPASATLEHIVLLSEGGEDTQENTKAACKRCNNERHTAQRVERTIAAWESLARLGEAAE